MDLSRLREPTSADFAAYNRWRGQLGLREVGWDEYVRGVNAHNQAILDGPALRALLDEADEGPVD